MFPPANRQHLQMSKVPLFSYIGDASLGCVFWIQLFVIIREFLQTSYVMFLAALVAQRGLSPDVNTQESSFRTFVFGRKDTPDRCISNLGLRHISCQKCISERHIVFILLYVQPKNPFWSFCNVHLRQFELKKIVD